SEGGRFVRWLLDAVVGVAAVEVAAMSLLLPWTWADYHREHGDLAVFPDDPVRRARGHGVPAAGGSARPADAAARRCTWSPRRGGTLLLADHAERGPSLAFGTR
ncbi:MAG: hypothetical protein OXG35_31855, partial [Acidobacteria bacterium]|nr:hypothetical protein [Acidobacteriota bacterium]